MRAFKFLEGVLLFAAGLSAEEILQELPDLEPQDIHACLSFAPRKLDHPVVVP